MLLRCKENVTNKGGCSAGHLGVSRGQDGQSIRILSAMLVVHGQLPNTFTNDKANKSQCCKLLKWDKL